VNRFIRVTELLVAEILPNDKILWWELEQMPVDRQHRYPLRERSTPLRQGHNGIRNRRVALAYHDFEEDPGFENVIRVIEDG
jgi:hypothetical protein